MKNINIQLLFIWLLISTHVITAQTEGIVVDSLTQQPIPYINIWVAGESIGTTSDENGQFVLKNINHQKNIIFSGIGYQTVETTLQTGNNKIVLAPQNIELATVIVSATKGIKETKIGGFKKSKINFYFGSNAQPKIRARYFPYKPSYNNALIKTININTRNEVKDARFHIRIYGANKDGQPSVFLHDKVIQGVAKKGNQNTAIEVSNLNLTFPETGIFIAMEWLIIDQNKYWDNGKDLETRKKTKFLSYAPLIGITTSEQNENSWIFENGQWVKVERNPSYYGKKERGKFNVIAMELVLIE